MTFEQISIEIAKTICHNFLDLHQSTARHGLVVRFEESDLLFEMESRGLCRPRNNQQDYLPSSGSFALLPREDVLYQRAERAFTVTILTLRNLFKTENSGEKYEAKSLAEKSIGDGPQPSAADYELGLYLCLDFGVYTSYKLADDGMTVGNVGVSESIIRIKDPGLAWANRSRSAHQSIPAARVPMEYLQQAMLEDDKEEFPVQFEGDEFWSLLHPSIIPEARKRFRSGLYAEAVEAAIKVVSNQIRTATGLDLDGVALMNEALSPNDPYLIFDPSGTGTARSMQEGYLNIFKGTIMAVRNPKAHGFVAIDTTRCIHFLYLASLLAYKIEEAQSTSRVTDGNT
jgi:uncharacterized protein (TIGR02391 family)